MTNLDYIKSIVELLKLDASSHKRLYSEDVLKIVLSIEIILEEWQNSNLDEFFETEFKQVKEI